MNNKASNRYIINYWDIVVITGALRVLALRMLEYTNLLWR